MKCLAIIWLFTVCINGFGQLPFDSSVVSNKIMIATDEMSRLTANEAFDKGSDSLRILFFQKFLFIDSVATETELYELTNYKKPYIRYVALYALSTRHSSRLLDLLLKNRGDTIDFIYLRKGHYFKPTTFTDELVDLLSANPAQISEGKKDLFNAVRVEREIWIRNYYLNTPNELIRPSY